MGYLIALLCQTFALYASAMSSVPCVCSMIGSCLLFITATKDITNDLTQLTIGGRSLKNREKIKKRFCKLVQCYLDLKELSVLRNFNAYYFGNWYNFHISIGISMSAMTFINLW